jgi:CBS domain containing-hemolysin-like protein
VLALAARPARQRQLEPLLARADTLATSAAVYKTIADLAFVCLLLTHYAAGEPTWRAIALTMLTAVPALLIVGDALASAVALRHGDALLVQALPLFHFAQLPLRMLVTGFEALRRALLRVMGLRTDRGASRQIVEGLREVIEVSEISGDLDATEREIIENVMEFRDVSVASVMTPRTEIYGVDVAEGVAGAVRVAADCGHGRLPVYEESHDRIIGTITARDLVGVVARGALSSADLRDVLHPALFVPETKRISELLSEFRRQKIKLAIVLDEYGGTAGLVTLGDIIAEIVGDIRDETAEAPEQPVRELGGGAAEVDAGLHVSEANERLGLAIPEEEDYETLGGFVLARLGHFPKAGESFVHDDVEYSVVEASDRRVLKVCVRRLVTA